MTKPYAALRWEVWDGATLLGRYPGSRSAAWFGWARAAGFVGVFPTTMFDVEIVTCGDDTGKRCARNV